LADGFGQQGGFARAGAGHQIQRKDAAVAQPLAVLRGIAIVLGQDVLLNLHHARLAQPRRMGMGRTLTVVQRRAASLLAERGLMSAASLPGLPVRVGMT
jgi:hypothetical protein